MKMKNKKEKEKNPSNKCNLHLPHKIKTPPLRSVG